MVQAVSANSTFHGDRPSREVFYKIPSDDWKNVDTADDFWITGDLVYSYRQYGDQIQVRHYNVRFEPQGVHSIVAPLLASQPLSKESAPDEDAAKGPRVSDAHLQAWFDVYQKVYGGSAEDTLDNAYKSARGMFPDKFVSRDRIRELAGGRTPGRKARKES